jgi:hypothetical protein
MKQAGYSFDPTSGWPIVTYSASPEKLVELIVRECAWTIRMTEFEDNMTQEQIARHIEDNFGVEK